MKYFKVVILVLIFLAIVGNSASAQTLPKITLGVEDGKDAKDFSVTLQILLLLTILTLAPSIIIMLTSFIRIIVIFSFMRHAIGTHQMPPNQLLVGLAIILTAFIMAPTITKVNETALQPYLNDEITQKEAYDIGIKPIREFMLKQVREKDLALFVSLSGIPKPDSPADLPTYLIIPGFVISELRIAFQISFIIFIPFLIIDMVVASVLMSMGMLMLPPIMVSLPFKILLFVLVDGWYLIIKSVVSSFH
ncbi:MAG: flagellar type III secretion system pore protein FliP [candidate division Zixibacteria bacterium]|nr:flagellar type III secretion system pore protein FliP [candidate division Zixibacteria bacterium]